MKETPFGIIAECFGVTFTIQTSNRELSSVVRDLVPRILPNYVSIRESDSTSTSFFLEASEGRYSLYKNNQASMIGVDKLEVILRRLSTEVRLLVGEQAVGRAFVHSGVVVVDDKAILLPGRTHTGKSTLTAALVSYGAKYYSDEYAIVDARGLVHPFLKPISLRNEKSKPIDIGTDKAHLCPVQVGMVFISEYLKNALWKPRKLTGAEGVLRLVENSLSIRQNPKFALRAFNRLAKSGCFYESIRAEADEAASSILHIFRTESSLQNQIYS